MNILLNIMFRDMTQISSEHNYYNEYNFKFPFKTTSFPWLLYFSAFTANLLLTTSGYSFAWFSPVIPKLQSNDTNVNPLDTPVTPEEVAVIVTVSHVTLTMSLSIWAKITDLIGRKKSLMAISVLFVSNLSMRAFASHIYVYYCALLLNGLAMSGSLIAVPVFLSEIAEDTNRATLGALMGMATPLGTLLGYSFASFTTVRSYTLICATPALIHLLLLIIVPESPVYLAMKGRKIDAVEALKQLKMIKNDKDLEVEYQRISNFNQVNKKIQKTSYLEIFKDPRARRAFFICMSVCVTQQFSGIYCVLSFMSSIVIESGSNVSGNTVEIIVGLVQIVVLIIVIYYVDKVGKRPLLLASSLICAVTLFFLALYLYLKSVESSFLDFIGWLPLLTIIVYIVGYNIGLGPLTISLLPEFFSNELRATSSAFVLILDNVIILTSLFAFPLLSAYLGMHYCIWFFSFFSFTGFLLMFFVLPETRGRSFFEIRAILERK